MIKYGLIIFDMDGTLYKLKTKGKEYSMYDTEFYDEVIDNGIRFLTRKLGVDEKRAKSIREDIFKKYKGEMSIGLEKEYGIERYEYFENTWNVDASKYLKSDLKLREILQKIEGKKAVFTTAPRIWTDRALTQLGIIDLFDGIWTGESDLRKPDEKAYLQIIEFFKVSPKESIMIDDDPINLIPAKKLGILTVLVRNSDTGVADFNIPSVYDILPLMLKIER